jgi:hypothetical protein
MANKKRSTPRNKKRGLPNPNAPTVTKTENSIHIEYSDPRHVLPALVALIPEFTEEHLASDPATANDDVLGTNNAQEVVSGCANSKCWTCTLGDLKLDSVLFQSCVQSGVKAKGYKISKNQIPASQDTQLFAVVIAIQRAGR